MNKVFRLLAAAVFAVLSLSGVALAQTAATGNIEGVVTDTTGAIVGRSTLGPGKDVGPYCEFLFTAQVPDRTMYRIEVDDRGGVLYSKAYLDFYHWNAGLALRGTRLTWL